VNIRLAIDVGGTFTDLFLEDDGTRPTVKVLNTLDRRADGLILGVDRILEQAGMEADGIELIVRGTTLATNAMIESKGPVVMDRLLKSSIARAHRSLFLPCSAALNIWPEITMVALPGGRGGPICQTERH